MSTEEYKEMVASRITAKSEIEIVRISHSLTDTLFLCWQLPDGTEFTDESGDPQVTTRINGVLSEESSGRVLLNERDFSIQGINDYIADYEEQIPEDNEEKIKVEVLTYIMDINDGISTIQAGPFRYFNQKTIYQQKNNTVTLKASTTQTNQNQTGVAVNKILTPTLAGF